MRVCSTTKIEGVVLNRVCNFGIFCLQILVENIPEVSSQPNEELWTEDIDGSDDENENPPCYEQVLTMSELSASEADLENQAG